MLLTPRDELHNGVADFIEDNGVETVYILGGAASSSHPPNPASTDATPR